MMNPTVVFPQPGEVVLENRAIPEPTPGHVRIRTRLSLISTGTELTMFRGQFDADSGWARYPYPCTPGYDNVGDIDAVGEGVDPSLIGQRVASYGNHALYNVMPVNSVRPIPSQVRDDEAVFFTIAEIVMNGLRRARLQWGESVVVFGLGLLGQFATRLCLLAGARPVIGIDVSDARLAMLPQHPAMLGVHAQREDVLAVIERVTRGRKADLVIELTGNAEFIPQQVPAIRQQGRFLILSSPAGKSVFDFTGLCNLPCIEIIGAHVKSHPPVATPDYPWTRERNTELFFDLIADGLFSLTDLITHRVPFTEAPETYRRLLHDRSCAMGVIFDWQQRQ
jgi:threonine dehydrogenase-like Zn-dependent dehydrogenase